MKKVIIGMLVALIVGGGYFLYRGYDTLSQLAAFYAPENITTNFRAVHKAFPHSVVQAGNAPYTFKYAKTNIPETFNFNGEAINIADFLAVTGTTGFLVMKDDTILFENYYQGEKEDDRHILFSVTKSFISALIGIALEEGRFESIEDPVTKYVPELKGSAFDGVSIKNILHMSSGVAFNEDYGDLTSDVNRMSAVIGLGGSLDDFTAELTKTTFKPGTYNDYVSVNTHVLGMLLSRVTGESVTSYLTRKIWQPIGMEYDGYFSIDGENVEVTMGGLQASLRDIAKMGRLYLHKGNWNGNQIVPEAWIDASMDVSAPHLAPGHNNPKSGSPFGYGYQWWIPVNPRGDFYAAGIYHQFIYVDPVNNIVIAKTSANKAFNDPANKNQKEMHTVMFQQIAEAMGGKSQ
jgi:CubicO group peptidase (beta-lactamase class C family)